MNKLRITHIITGLGNGGAEGMLVKLLKNFDYSKFEINVISITKNDYYFETIIKMGVDVQIYDLNKSPLTNLIKTIRACSKSNIIQTWMYHADFVGFLIKIFYKNKKVIWGIRQAEISFVKNDNSLHLKFRTRLLAKINARLSKYIDQIVSCSEKAVIEHKELGYECKNMLVIPNGFETMLFKRDQSAKEELFNQIGIANKSMITILNVGRWNIRKDHHGFLDAIYILKQCKVDFKVIMCGKNIDYNNKELVNKIEILELTNKIYLLGERSDMPFIMSCGDIYVSASVSEGFPNVICEAMLCENYCVVTDAGDSKLIIGSHGKVVSPRNSEELALAIKSTLEMETLMRKVEAKKGKQKIEALYSIQSITKSFEKLYC